MTDSRSKAATFVRGFFTFLEARGLRAAVLHGGSDGFERTLSDVDFVVDRDSFPELASIVHEYCRQSGWQLCQVLRHETTAAYFVCSATDAPSCAVALDACSDYQRNGSVFLTADSLLRERERLPWGGFALPPATELRYRFAKAAAKNKDAAESAEEFELYPEPVRDDCKTWLLQEWGIPLADWIAAPLGEALRRLRDRSNSRPSLLQRGSLRRVASRILQPAGMVVVTDPHEFDAIASRLQRDFGHLYFRHYEQPGHWRFGMFKRLARSTLVVLPQLSRPWEWLLPSDCVHRLHSGMDIDSLCIEFANHLSRRCGRRERLSRPSMVHRPG
ncbi:MAG: hypothetical protein V4689_14415 [Verrucomicrobiota bacterium]